MARTLYRLLRFPAGAAVAVVCGASLLGASRAEEAGNGPTPLLRPVPAIGSLLVARRGLPDPHFRDSVVLLLAYGGDEGTAGVIVNRRSDHTIGEVTPESSPLTDREDKLFFGGPVAPSAVIVLLRQETGSPEAGTEIMSHVFLLSGRGALEDLAEDDVPPARVRFYAGYAGWSPGQLEAEIAHGDWYLVRGDASWVFSRHPESAWESLTHIVFAPRA